MVSIRPSEDPDVTGMTKPDRMAQRVTVVFRKTTPKGVTWPSGATPVLQGYVFDER